MKILHIIPSISSESGGPPRSTRATIQALNDYSTEAHNTILTTDLGLTHEWKNEYIESLGGNSQVIACKQYGKHTTNISFELFRWLYTNVTKFDLVVIRAMLHPISTISSYIVNSKNVPYVITPHGTLSNYTFEHKNTVVKRIYFRLFERRSVNGSKYVQATTRSEKEQIEDLNISTQVKKIPHPYLDNSVYQRDNVDQSRILYMSRLHPSKGLDRLLPVLKRLKDKGFNFSFRIAGTGDGNYENKLRNQVHELGLGEIVNFLGFLEGEKKKLELERAGLFVLPSYKENFGIAVVEAMNTGIPVVISKEVDIYPEVNKYNAGFVFKNEEELEDAISKLLESPDLAKTMGEKGKRLVDEEYGEETIGKMLYSLYKKAISI